VEPFFAEYLKILETLHSEIVQALDGLPPEAVNWAPLEGANSFAVLAVHTAGAERYWIGDVAMREPSDRDRDAEFRTTGITAEAALGPLQSSLLYAQNAVPRLTLADLNAARTAPRDGRQVAVAWALLHALEHTAMHAGHAQLTRQLWEAQNPPQ
jgi:hypothetical protein